MTTDKLGEVLTAARIPRGRWGAERLRSLTEGERAFYRWILTSFADATPPRPDELAGAASELGLEVEPTLARLGREDLVHHDPGTGAILVAYPFSGRPTAHRVRFDGREVYAMCAIDALGIPFMLRAPAEIESRDALGGEEIRAQVDPSAGVTWTPQTAVVVVGAEAGDGPSAEACCRFVNFFASAERARSYLAQSSSLRGEVVSIPEAAEAGRVVFGGLLDET